MWLLLSASIIAYWVWLPSPQFSVLASFSNGGAEGPQIIEATPIALPSFLGPCDTSLGPIHAIQFDVGDDGKIRTTVTYDVQVRPPLQMHCDEVIESPPTVQPLEETTAP